VRAVQRDALGEDEDADMASDTSSDSDESDVSPARQHALAPDLPTLTLPDRRSKEEFYTEPPLPEELLAARRKIARFSLPLAQRRLRQQRAEAALPLPKILQVRRKVFGDLKKTVLLGSQIGDTRPISTVRFSPCSTMVATGSWTGGAKIWGVPNLNEVSSLKGASALDGAAAIATWARPCGVLCDLPVIAGSPLRGSTRRLVLYLRSTF
jgi:WD40 repeat protein